MSRLRLLGSGFDAVFTTTSTPTPEQRMARYWSAVLRNPCPWRAERVAFGQILQDAFKAGITVSFHVWQGQLPALWPHHCGGR